MFVQDTKRTIPSLTPAFFSNKIFTSIQEELKEILQLPTPIGIYDSGLGGLQVLWNLYQVMPHKNFLYFADLHHMPYGNRSADEIVELSKKNSHFLEEQGCTLVIAACHTSTTWLKAAHFTPSKCFLSMADSVYAVVQNAVFQDNIKEITILATQGTLNSGVYQEYFTRTMPQLTLRTVPCPHWVPAIESQDEVQKRKAVIEILHHINTTPAIVYGCTHFSEMDSLLQEYLPFSCLRLDPGIALANIFKEHAQVFSSSALEYSCRDRVRVFTNVTWAPQLALFLKKFSNMQGSVEYIPPEKILECSL
ncbi:glutamate racemase [Holospora curviuscula]|uniref:Glutamate racemase n=1 Tax=Holospora curviuscula TaxID=1082868 RepID=A0A2S5R900_9PROT|nr:aspartate/glutamate racemase family protein [Holospora curviuscula]PPE03809.1 Glutamate racemase [Holospora curviuscula]